MPKLVVIKVICNVGEGNPNEQKASLEDCTSKSGQGRKEQRKRGGAFKTPEAANVKKRRSIEKPTWYL